MIEDIDELIDSKLSVHDRHRFEVKLDMELKKDRENVYKVEYFFFIPKSLNISTQTYTKDVFYSDTQHYIRFKTPNIALDKLFYVQNELSPYNRIIKNLNIINSGGGDQFILETLLDEIKLLGCVVRVEIKENVDFFSKAVKINNSVLSKDNPILESLSKFRDDINLALDSLNLLKTRILTSNLNAKVRESFLFLDEYSSLMIEEYITAFLSEIPAPLPQTGVLNDLKNLAISQREYRKSMGYRSVLNDGSDEYFLYHRSLLKKFISSALYLRPEVSEFNLLMHIGPGIAAALAMLFAIVVTIYAQNKYAINSLNFILVVVIGYVFKDRIKDWLKLIFSKKMVNWLFDRKINVTTPAHSVKIGYIKEAFSFLPADFVPGDIYRIRNADNIKTIEEDTKQEVVFKYKKEIGLNPEAISLRHKRRKDLIDIMRFSVFDYIKQADDENVNYKLTEKDGSVKEVSCLRLYHINMVMKYHVNSSGEVRYERVRILLNKNGIYKLEEIKVA